MAEVDLDRVWMIVSDRDTVLQYSPPGTSPQEAWTKAYMWDMAEGGASRPWNERDKWVRAMVSMGWRARRVQVVLL